MAGIAAMLLVLLPIRGDAGDVRWYFQPERAFAVAKALGRPVMLDLVNPSSFTFDWFDSFLLRDGRVVQATRDKVVPLRLKINEVGKDFHDRYRVPTSPAILFMTPDEQPIWRTVGRVTVDGFLDQMHQAARIMPGMNHYLHVAATGRGSTEDLASAATVSVALGQEDVALSLLHKAGWQRNPLTRSLGDAALNLADTYRASGRFQDALALLNVVARQKDSPQVARALYGIAVCRWNSGQTREAVATFDRVASMGEIAGDYRYISRRMMGRFGMMPMIAPSMN